VTDGRQGVGFGHLDVRSNRVRNSVFSDLESAEELYAFCAPLNYRLSLLINIRRSKPEITTTFVGFDKILE
jgi:hypothetical protein